MLEEKGIKVEFDEKQEINVIADDFYIEQVITNYLTNAIKNAKEINGEKIIKISNDINKENNKVCVKVFNTGENIKEEDIKASFKNGTLTLTFPKEETKQIENKKIITIE